MGRGKAAEVWAVVQKCSEQEVEGGGSEAETQRETSIEPVGGAGLERHERRLRHDCVQRPTSHLRHTQDIISPARLTSSTTRGVQRTRPRIINARVKFHINRLHTKETPDT